MASQDTLIDGKYFTPEPVGAPRYEYPFRMNGDRASAIFEQEFWQRKDNWTPQEIPIPHETMRDFYMMNETDPIEFIAGMYKFTRTYARIPAQQIEYSSIVVTMPQPTSAAGKEIPFNGMFTNSAVFFSDGTSTDIIPGMYQVPSLGTGTVGPNYFFGQNTFFRPFKLGNGVSYSGNTANGIHPNTITTIKPGRTLFRCDNHGFTNGAPVCMVISAASPWTATLFDSTDWDYVNANYFNGPNRDTGNFVAQGNVYFAQANNIANTNSGSFGSGSRFVRCKRITDFYLPGVSAGITTPADIPLPADQSVSSVFLAALLAGTGTVNVQVGELARWRGSPIYSITKTTVEVVDLL